MGTTSTPHPFSILLEKGVGVQFPGIGSKPQPRTKKKNPHTPSNPSFGNCRVAARSVEMKIQVEQEASKNPPPPSRYKGRRTRNICRRRVDRSRIRYVGSNNRGDE
ncbi:hypothetical protein CEXT_212591 [Caerostris extrusa]|uniref:Uncharacterized protein n=1 Tax=Caerostris extrusa TaxID=172846 RepID=A0AAV4WUB1_CAEEX|nr:hypothetical protein CEXT_212591 [Caerostris extrusa]